MTTRNFVVKNGLQVGTVTIDASSSNITAGNVSAGNLLLANFANITSNIVSNNVTVNLELSGNTANFSGNIKTLNANLGNLGTANFLSVTSNVTSNNSTVNLQLTGNTANFSGNVSVSGIKTDNYYYSNGSPVDFQQAAGSNTQIQYNSNNDFGASANFTFNSDTNTLNVTGTILGSNIYANSGTVGASLLTGTLTTASQPNITSVGTLGNLVVSGNIQSNTNVITDYVLGKSTSVTITAAAGNNNIDLRPTGTGTVDVGNFRITALATPTQATDAATKDYVDTTAQGLDPKGSVQFASNAVLPAYTYNNGTSGVGATITANANGALTLDGGTPSVGARVLIKNEINTNQPYNGIYVVTATGSASAAFVLTRATDFDNNSPSGEIPGAFVFVEEGTVNADTGWVCTTNSPVTVGTTAITFVQFSGAGSYTAGTGLTLNGSQFSISNTTVTAGSYGNGDRVATFTVNDQGQLTAASNVAITANAANLSGNTLASGITTSSLTTVGTLGNLSVTGNITGGNLNTAGYITANGGAYGEVVTTPFASVFGTGSGPNPRSIFQARAADLTAGIGMQAYSGINGQIYSNTGITFTTGATVRDKDYPTGGTSRATIDANGLSVTGTANITGNANVGGILTDNYYYANGSPVDFQQAAGSNTQIQFNSNSDFGASANFTFNSATNLLTVVGSANLGNAVTANYFIGSGANLANINGANVTGTVANATHASTADSATTAGTVTTAAQPNITSVGNLTSLVVSGNLSSANANLGNLATANYFSGVLVTAAQPNITSVGTLSSLAVTANITAGNIYANSGTIGASLLTGTLTTAAQPNVTSLGTLTNLVVSGNTTTGNLKLNGGLTSNRTNVAVTTNTVLDQFNPVTYRTAKYVVSAAGDDGYQSVEALLVHDGSNSYITVYGSVCSNVTADIVEITSNINGISGNVAVYATTLSGNTKVNLVAAYIQPTS